MTELQPRERIRLAEKEVGRLHEDVDEWGRDYGDAEPDRGFWADLVARANFVFDRIQRLDSDLQEAFLTDRLPFDEGLASRVEALYRDWLETSLKVLGRAERLGDRHDPIEGGEELKASISEARGIVSPSSEFDPDGPLAHLRDEAIRDHRAGRTETWNADEHRTA